MMFDLIERLKAATEGTAELDMAIAVAAGRERETHVIRYQDGVSQRVPWRADGAGGTIPTPCYSRSLDAAVTLVLAGLFWGVGCSPGKGHAWVGPEITVEASTPALALCIAALMATEERT